MSSWHLKKHNYLYKKANMDGSNPKSTIEISKTIQSFEIIKFAFRCFGFFIADGKLDKMLKFHLAFCIAVLVTNWIQVFGILPCFWYDSIGPRTFKKILWLSNRLCHALIRSAAMVKYRVAGKMFTESYKALFFLNNNQLQWLVRICHGVLALVILYYALEIVMAVTFIILGFYSHSTLEMYILPFNATSLSETEQKAIAIVSAIVGATFSSAHYLQVTFVICLTYLMRSGFKHITKRLEKLSDTENKTPPKTMNKMTPAANAEDKLTPRVKKAKNKDSVIPKKKAKFYWPTSCTPQQLGCTCENL